MKFDVVVVPRAELQVLTAAAWWAEHRSERQSTRWMSVVRSALEQLESNADSLPFAPESRDYGVEIRQHLVGIGSHPTHRIVFVIRGNRVSVFAVLHLAQDSLSPSDIPPE